ncbi:MAG: hypothetical protein VX265_18035 [Myxococcota bacterium]|nr:hypothetical protein [Myxococcota bacterium]
MSDHRLRDHLRAAAVFLVGGALLMAGFPGLDYASARDVRSLVAPARALATPLGMGMAAVAGFNEGLRRPVARALRPVERLFRVSQEFHLYRDGPNRVDRLEVLIDDVLVYRTRDAAHDWRAAQFGNRHFRPMVATAALKPAAANQEGICRWIVARAREDFPDAREVEIRSTRTRFGVDEPWVRFSRVARDPDWVVSGVRKEAAP